MLAKFFLQFVLASVFGIGVDDGYATLYGDPGDQLAGGNLACWHRPIPQNEAVCAHRWLPCGTEVTVVNLERPGTTTCRIGDRGPYGVDRFGRWRGVIDLTPHVAKAVRLDGRDVVRLLYLLPKRGHPAYDNPTVLKSPPRRSRATM
jgi:rare lipoprotein A (peptidoglycan hydrolase)